MIMAINLQLGFLNFAKQWHRFTNVGTMSI